MEDLLQVGAITQTHGIRGEVKVFPLTDDVGRFKKGISLTWIWDAAGWIWKLRQSSFLSSL